MPTYRSISLKLISIFDLLVIGEYPPPSQPSDPFSTAPQLIDTTTATVSTYIPNYPGSQFWLAYAIAPPYPPNALYYFKLLVNGVEVVSWGVDEEDEFKGKTMFALSEVVGMGGMGWERRALTFAKAKRGSLPKGAMDDVMEVRVFRSKGRKRVVPEPNGVPKVLMGEQEGNGVKGGIFAGPTVPKRKKGTGIELVNAGLLPHHYPQRFYRYALLDPVDKPFATFRYYYRTMDELYALNVIPNTPSSPRSSESTARSHQTTTSDAPSTYSPADNPTSTVILHDYNSSPLSKISEERSSFLDLSGTPTPTSPTTPTPPPSSQDPDPACMTHKRTPSSPLRIPRLIQQSQLTSPTISLAAVTRPPTPPRHVVSPTSASQLHSSLRLVNVTAKPSTPPNSPPKIQGSGTRLKPRSSREDFKNLVSQGKKALSPSRAARGVKKEMRTPETVIRVEEPVGRTGSGKSVGALRKMFERGGG